MKNARYILVTDHRAEYNFEDEKIIMNAKNAIDAICEATARCKLDENLYCVLIYEEYELHSFKRVLRCEGNTCCFHCESSNAVIREVVEGKGKNKRSTLFYDYI